MKNIVKDMIKNYILWSIINNKFNQCDWQFSF